MSTPLTIVIFGASGDLTSRKLIPALYHLAAKQRLPPEAKIVGVARTPMTDEQFHARVAEAQAKPIDQGQPLPWAEFARRLHYVPGDAASPGPDSAANAGPDTAPGGADDTATGGTDRTATGSTDCATTGSRACARDPANQTAKHCQFHCPSWLDWRAGVELRFCVDVDAASRSVDT